MLSKTSAGQSGQIGRRRAATSARRAATRALSSVVNAVLGRTDVHRPGLQESFETSSLAPAGDYLGVPPHSKRPSRETAGNCRLPKILACRRPAVSCSFPVNVFDLRASGLVGGTYLADYSSSVSSSIPIAASANRRIPSAVNRIAYSDARVD